MLPEYHKGQLCIYRFLLCQEGFCSECALHKQHKRNKSLKNKELSQGKLIEESQGRVLVVS